MKSDQMNSAIKAMTGIDVNNSIETKVCATCGKPVTEFRDPLSEKEFGISGMCQKCQDSIWGSEDEIPF